LPVLNVKPQNVNGGPYRPLQRRPVTLNDHHQTWLANYNEIRNEVNTSTAYNVPQTILFRNEYGNFGANSIFANQMVFGTDDPYADPSKSPITINSTEFTLSSSVTMTVKGPAKFSNNVNFDANSFVTVDGPFIANAQADFNDLVNFYALTHFHPTSVLLVDGPSIFNDDISITADVTMVGDYTLTGNITQSGNTTVGGNLTVDDDLLVRGNLTVLGDSTTLEVTELVVEDKNIVINKNDVYTPLDAGIFIQKGTLQNAGYFKVHQLQDDLLQFKAPGAHIVTVDIPNKDVYLRLYDDFAADQELLTTSNVAFRSVKVDTSFGRHNGVPSYTQENDPIAATQGWVSTPWVYTNAVEASDNLSDANTTGLYMGAGTFTIRDEISLVSKGKPKMFLDYFGNIGFGTTSPISDLHLYKTDPTFTITTNDYTSKGTLSFTDFGERIDDAGMYLSFDANTGSGLLEVTTDSFSTEFSISVGGYQKTAEIVITDDKVTLNDDLYVYGESYVRDTLIVDNTLFVRTNKVGVNIISPTQAVDVSGNIQGDSDLILNGMEPFVLIGDITSLESMGRSGLAIEEQSPLIQLSTTETNYRHGSIVYFNDAIHDSHWVIGTTHNGDKLDLGKSFSRTANTPEHGLDEYYGETLLRFTEEDRAEMYFESDTSNAGLILNTRTNGIQLYLGEQNDVLTTSRSTLAYTNNSFSSVIQWHGDTSNDSIGELSYFPNGNDDGEFGSFRFSRTDGVVNQGVPSAKVGANQFFANDKIGISQTTPTAELHITKNYAESLVETEDKDTFVKISVNDSTSTATVRGEHTSGSSYFNLSAVNPATLELVSGNYNIVQSANNASNELQIDLSESVSPSSFVLKTNTSATGFSTERTGSQTEFRLYDSNPSAKIHQKLNSKTANSVHEFKLIDTNIHVQTNVDAQRHVLDLDSNFRATESIHAGNDYIKNYIDSSAVHANTLINLSSGAKTLFELSGTDIKWISENPLNTFEIHNRQIDGKLDVGFSSERYKLKHTDPTDVAIYCAYRDRFVLKLATTFESPAYFNDKVVANSTVDVQGTFTANGAAQFNNNVAIEGSFVSNGVSTFNSTLVSNDEFLSEGTSTFNNDVTFTDDVTYSSTSTTSFNGPSTFNDEVTYSSSSNTTFNGPSQFNEDLTINESATFDVKSSNTSFSNTVNFYSTTVLGGDTYVGGGGISSNDDPNFKLAWKKELANISGIADVMCFSGFNTQVFSIMGDVDVYIYDQDFSNSPFGVSYLNLKIAGYKIPGQSLNMTLQETQTSIGDDYASAYTKVVGNCIKLYPATKASDPTQDAGTYDYKVIFRGVIKNGDLS